MNNLFAILIAVFLTSCGSLCLDCGGGFGSYPTEVTYYFINETSDSIISKYHKNIGPNDTLKVNMEADLSFKHSVDDFPVNISRVYLFYTDGDKVKYENGVNDIQNYEDRKEVSPSVFEFTFRLTEERKAKEEHYGYYPVKATVYFINETNETIVSRSTYKNIAPKDTLKVDIGPILEAKEKPTIDNFPLSYTMAGIILYKDGDVYKCDYGSDNIADYENRKEVSPSVFEFTFRFTEERKAKATACSYY